MAELEQDRIPSTFEKVATPFIRAGNALFVTLYKAAGFAVLFVVLGALVSYLCVHIFFWASSSWMAPAILSTTDEHVLQIESEISVQELARDKLLDDRIDMTSRIRALQLHRRAQGELKRGIRSAVAGGLRDRKLEAATLKRASDALKSAGPQQSDANTAYAGQLQNSTDQLAKAHLLTQDEITQRQYQISQIALENANLAEKAADLTNRIHSLDRESESFGALGTSSTGADPALTEDVLRLKSTMDVAELSAKQDVESERDLLDRVALQDASLRRIDAVLASLYGSPYLQAAVQEQVLAFVPYPNIGHVWPGQTIYSCRLVMLWCDRAGQVKALMPGEVLGKNPITGKDIRGVYVKIELSRKRAAQEQVVYVGSKPLWL